MPFAELGSPSSLQIELAELHQHHARWSPMEKLHCCLLVALIISSIISGECLVNDQSTNPIGVNYGTRANNLPPPEQVVRILQNTNIGKVKLYDANPAVLRAFARSSFDITVGIANEQISSLVDPNAALTWVNQNVAAYLPDTRIRVISVGNEVLTSKNQPLASLLLPVMKSLQSALVTLKLDAQIKVTTPHSLAILSTSFPPSSGAFRPDITALGPLLSFLSDTNSTFMVNAYPYVAYRSNPRDISLAYALFLPNTGVTDPGTGIVYSNMFGAMLDAVISAMNKLRYFNVRIGVSETGWPSLGDPNEPGVSLQNAMTYNKNLIYYISSKPGTPLRPKQQIDTYIFSLFNENLKAGPASEKNYGLFRPDGSVVYDVGILRSGSVITPPPTPFTPSPPTPPVTTPSPPSPVTPPGTTPSPVITPTPPGTTPSPVINPSPPAVTPPSPVIIPTPPVVTPPSPVTTPPVTPPSPVTHPTPPVTTPVAPPSPVTYPSPTPPSPVTYPSPTPPSSGTPGTPSGGTPSGGHTGAPIWCVAKPNAEMGSLLNALNYACGEGGADCSAIQPGGPCFYPNDPTSHASYAFNSYYQKHGRNYWNCDFMSSAVVAISDPSYGSCSYPAKYP